MHDGQDQVPEQNKCLFVGSYIYIYIYIHTVNSILALPDPRNIKNNSQNTMPEIVARASNKTTRQVALMVLRAFNATWRFSLYTKNR